MNVREEKMIRMMLEKGWFLPLNSEKPLIFEKGGASKREGVAQIICDKDFSPLIPLRVITIGSTACGKHAAFEAEAGIRILKTYQKNGEFLTTVYKINKVERWYNGEFMAYLSVDNQFSFGQWKEEPDTDKMLEAISAAHKKATCIRCRTAYYYKRGKRYV